MGRAGRELTLQVVQSPGAGQFGNEQPIRFLNNRRAIRSVLSKNQAVSQQFYEKYGDKYSVVSEYYNDVKHLVEIIDLKNIVPAFAGIG